MIESDIRVYGDLTWAWVLYCDAFTLMRHGDRWSITSLAFAPAED